MEAQNGNSNLLPRFGGKLLSLVFATALSLVVAEVLTRIFVPDPAFRHENRIGIWQPDPLVGYKNKAMFRGYAWGFVPVETNRLAFRGREVSIPKPDHTFRIVGLGDSITWGAGVRDEDTYLRILERVLTEAYSAKFGIRFETVNTGVVGYSTHQELLTLQRDGLPLCPDLVTVGFTPNDFYPTEDPFHNVHTFHLPVKINVGRFVYPDSRPVRFYFFRMVRSQLKLLWLCHARDAEVTQPELIDWASDSFEAQSWPIMEQHFRAMKQLAEEHGFGLLVLLFPGYVEVHHRTESGVAQRRLAEFLAA